MFTEQYIYNSKSDKVQYMSHTAEKMTGIYNTSYLVFRYNSPLPLLLVCFEKRDWGDYKKREYK